MDSTEPAMIDNHGARWKSTNTYELVPSAVRYQQYERSFSAQVSTFTPGIQINIPWNETSFACQCILGNALLTTKLLMAGILGR